MTEYIVIIEDMIYTIKTIPQIFDRGRESAELFVSTKYRKYLEKRTHLVVVK